MVAVYLLTSALGGFRDVISHGTGFELVALSIVQTFPGRPSCVNLGLASLNMVFSPDIACLLPLNLNFSSLMAYVRGTVPHDLGKSLKNTSFNPYAGVNW